jgi:hypothetical protein
VRPAGASEAIHEEEALGRAYDTRLLLRLWRFVSPYRAQVALTLGLVLPIFALELAPAWIVKTGLDHLVGAGSGSRLAAWLEPPAALPPLAWVGGRYRAAVGASSGLT